VTRQRLTVIIKLASSACGARVYWVKNLTQGRSCNERTLGGRRRQSRTPRKI